MVTTQLAPPYPIFTDRDGSPLDAGYLYFGAVNENPETNPIQVYYDTAFTIPAAQPLRTSNGYVMRNGSPALVYAGSQFSVTVRNKKNELVIYSPVGYGVDPASISGSVIYDDFTGDGVTTIFTITATPSTKNATSVYIDGVYQSKNNYNTSGSTLTFSTAPPLLSAIEVVSQESSIIGGASSQQISYVQGGAGSVSRTVQGRLQDFVSVKDFGAVGDGVTDDTAAIQAAINAVRSTSTDGIGRFYAGTVFFQDGNYKITSALSLSPASGVVGLTLQGSGSASTNIIFSGAATTITGVSSRDVTFSGMSFISSGVDDLQSAFTINQTGNPLRSWRFDRCEFGLFWKCFLVTGPSMCSEFHFQACQFSQCYYLMDNSNDQAVNWNFFNCNWENVELTTTQDKNLASLFKLQKGTFAKWTGGSLIFQGMLAYFNLTTSASFQRTSHKIVFDGVRIELVDNAGSHAYMMDRPSVGYINGSNHPTLAMTNFSILNRGTLPATTPYFKVWGNCSLALTNGEAEGGIISGVLDSVTPTANADVRLMDTRGIKYVEDTAARLNSHDSHNVHIEPDTSSSEAAPILDLKLSSLSVAASAMAKRLYVRGPTGSLPQGGTTVNLPALQDHFTILNIFCYRFGVAGQALTVDLRDQADTTTYGTVTVNAGVTNGEGYVGKEMGYQIPSGTALMLKFTGTPEVIKGVVGVEYL